MPSRLFPTRKICGLAKTCLNRRSLLETRRPNDASGQPSSMTPSSKQMGLTFVSSPPRKAPMTVDSFFLSRKAVGNRFLGGWLLPFTGLRLPEKGLECGSGFRQNSSATKPHCLPRSCFHLGRQTESENNSLNPTNDCWEIRSPLPASTTYYELHDRKVLKHSQPQLQVWTPTPAGR